MKTFKLVIFFAFSSMLLIVACNPSKMVTRKLVGEWQVAEIKEQNAAADALVSTNIGVISLNPDNTGLKISSFSVMGLTRSDTTHFTWINTQNSIIINTEDESIGKLWIISELKKNNQVWKTTDGNANMQIMKLERKR